MITKPLLASKVELHEIRYPVCASPKLDGIRCLIINGEAVSRNFKPIPNNYIRKTLKGLPDGLDGELMLRNEKASFQDISSAVMSFEGEPDFIYHVFDYDIGSHGYSNRDAFLIKEIIFNFKDQYPLRRVNHRLIENEDQLLTYEETCLRLGYEGVMIRDPNGKYKCGRSTVKEGILLKLKRFEDSEAVVLKCIEKETNTNKQERDAFGNAKRSSAKAGKVKSGTLGSFEVRDVKTGVVFSVGSGFDDLFRKRIWKEPWTAIGRVIKYKYQPTGVKEAPRFPVFLGFREQGDL